MGSLPKQRDRTIIFAAGETSLFFQATNFTFSFPRRRRMMHSNKLLLHSPSFWTDAIFLYLTEVIDGPC